MPTIEQLEALLAKEPDDAFLNFDLAMALAKAGRTPAALERFDRTLQINPNYVAAYFHEARLLADIGRAGEARAILEKGIAAAGAIGDEHARGEMSELLAMLG